MSLRSFPKFYVHTQNVETQAGCHMRRHVSIWEKLFQFSSVQFSSRWYICARKSPYELHPVSQKFPQVSNGSNVRLIEDGPRLALPLSTPLSSSNEWCNVLVFVPAVSVSSCSTLQISEKQATCKGCFPRQSICSVISLHSEKPLSVTS